MTDHFADNRSRNRYELRVGEHMAFADYQHHPGLVSLTHVEAAIPLRGTGAAGRLMEQIVATVRAEGGKIRPVCSYAVAWMRRHPEHGDLLA
jgi:predicted GNAT family acetyltransferase